MDPVMLLFLIGVGFALKAGLDHARKGAADSRSARLKDIKAKHPNIGKTRRSAMLRRHDLGYWAGETLKGFPEARNGLAVGWHAHKTAADEARLAREKARADHEENRASIREQAGVHRRRMAMALEEQRRAAEAEKPQPERKLASVTPLSVPLAAVPDPPKPDRHVHITGRRGELLAATGLRELRALCGVSLTAPPGWTDPGPDAPACPDCARKARWASPEAAPADGSPEGSPESGPEAAPPVPPAGETPSVSGPQTQPATNGAPVTNTAEHTYTEDLAEANAIVSEAEQHLADLERRKWADRMEALASAGLDSGTLSSAADMNDSINAQIKAAKETIDHATAFRDGLVRKHEPGHEYHSSSPNGGATREYLADR